MVKNGFIFIVAGGNDGPKYMSINFPGNMDEVITVGSFDPIKLKVSDFSSRGPWVSLNLFSMDLVKPNLLVLGEEFYHKNDKCLDIKGTSFSTVLFGTLILILFS